MKVLLFGTRGQVGWELQRSLAPLGELITLDLGSTDLCGDLADLQGLAESVRTVSPDVIVNAAAYTAVDKAESEPDLARRINATAPGILAQEADKLGAWLVHYSTDYVFDGSGTQPWVESDPTGPLNVYGETKLQGEQLVAANCKKHLIFRTSWVYAARGDNFAKTILRLAGDQESLRVVNDQIGAPTEAGLLADVTAHAIRRVLSPLRHNSLPLAGVYHVVAGGHISWYGYARFVLEAAHKAGLRLKARPDSVDPIHSSDHPTPACRPHNSRLDNTLFQNTFGLNLPHWQSGATRMLTEVIEKQS
jgi:dTDP-4-dehydrorhamnose reductase